MWDFTNTEQWTRREFAGEKQIVVFLAVANCFALPSCWHVDRPRLTLEGSLPGFLFCPSVLEGLSQGEHDRPPPVMGDVDRRDERQINLSDGFCRNFDFVVILLGQIGLEDATRDPSSLFDQQNLFAARIHR